MTPNEAMKRTSLIVTIFTYAKKIDNGGRSVIAALGVNRCRVQV